MLFILPAMNKLTLARCSGRMANQIWMVANIIAFAKENNLQVHAPFFLKIAANFEYWNHQTLITIDQKGIPNNWLRKYFYFLYQSGIMDLIKPHVNLMPGPINKLLLRRKSQTIHKVYFNDTEYASVTNSIIANKHTLLSGFMFCSSVKLMKENGGFLRHIFKPQSSVQLYLKNKISEIKAGHILVGVHIRRGDYKYYRNGAFYFPFEFYAGKMVEIQQLLDKPVQFVLCSDETIPSELFKRFELLNHTKSDAVTDMYMLAKCAYIIAPPSTYSKWASFYGEVLLANVSETPLTLKQFKVYYNHYEE